VLSRRIAVRAALYVGIALASGLLIVGLLETGCENVDAGSTKDGICTGLNDYGGAVLLVLLPPAVVAWAAVRANARRQTESLNRVFLGVLLLLPVVGLALPELVLQVWPE
jgi:hypothetical protein